jgi:Uma2 family endonuclease
MANNPIVKPAGAVTPTPVRVHYPDSDGEPMADSDDQYEAMVDAKFALVNFFRHKPMVYVAANLLIYYQQGDPTKRVAPDLFVVFEVRKRKRGSYKLWLEKRLPAIVFEIASPGTWKKDVRKKPLYEALKIPEYIMFDPFGDYFEHVLAGFRYVEGVYQPIPALPSETEIGLSSEQLGLEIWARPGLPGDLAYLLRFRDPKTGNWLLSQNEAEESRLAAEAQVAALQAELDRLRAERPEE